MFIQDANGNQTAYTYDNRDRVTTVYLDADKDEVTDSTESSVAYLYASGRLSGINTATTAYTITYDTFGNMVSVSAGGNVLATYTYASGNGKLQKLTYGNGDYEDYTYDNLDRLVKVTYNGSTTDVFTVLYDSNGRLAKAVDGKAGITYLYEYDSLDRLIRAYQKDSSGNTVFAVENSYDSYGRPTGSTIIVGSKTLTYSLTYKTNTNLVSQMSMPSASVQSVINYTYDSFDRLTVKNISLSSLAELYERYTYYTYTDTNGTVHTTPLVSRVTLENAYGGTTSTEYYDYTYNALGYITNVKKNGTTIASYGYDALGQLTTETNTQSGEIYVYTYDKAGNITKKEVYTGDIGNLTDTINYTYSTSAWGDLLTNYNGTAITYDEIGNPTKWRNSSNLSWDGRTLTSQTLTNGDTITYKYNSDGIRTQKRVYDSSAGSYITHDYVLDGTTIVKETVTSGTATTTLEYYYDESGIVSVNYNGTLYHYIKNLQGDVIGIVNSSSGSLVVEYTYDAWGNILSVTGSLASTVGQANPFRYRGYYFDSETGLYYLNSRYYDAAVGRFINADGIVGANGGIMGYNMFAYCNNNPVAFSDSSGYELEYELDPDISGPFDILDDDYGGGGSGFYCTFNAAMYSNLYSGGIYNCGVEFGYTSLGVYSWYYARQNVKAADTFYYTNGYARNDTGSNTNSKSNSKNDKTTKTCRNPNGRKGGIAHQTLTNIIKATFEVNGYLVSTEYYIKTLSGEKSCRFVDVCAIKDGTTVFIQVGKQTKSGTPISREQRAMNDIYNTTGIMPIFVPYNNIKGS